MVDPIMNACPEFGGELRRLSRVAELGYMYDGSVEMAVVDADTMVVVVAAAGGAADNGW